MVYEILLAVNGFGSVNRLTSKDFVYCLHTEAYSQDGNSIAEMPYHILAYTGLRWIFGSRGDTDPARSSTFNFFQGNDIMTKYFNGYSKSRKKLKKIEGKRIVIVYHEKLRHDLASTSKNQKPPRVEPEWLQRA
jgi:hypothetical protein